MNEVTGVVERGVIRVDSTALPPEGTRVRVVWNEDPMELRSILERIAETAALRPNWDGEGGTASSRQAVARAEDLVRRAFSALQNADLIWEAPAVVPSGSGGIDLSWQVNGRRLLIVVPKEPEQPLVCVTKEPGGRPLRRAQSVGDAAEKIAWALSPAT